MPTRRDDDAASGRALDTVELLPGLDRPGGDVMEHRAEPSAWERRWRELPPARRRRLTAGAVVALTAGALVGGGVQARAWLSERAERQRVSLTTTVGVWTSSSTPPGGHVTYFLEVANGGTLPLEVTSVRASAPGLEVSARDGNARDVAAGEQILVPLSVRLTCADPSGPEPSGTASSGAAASGVRVRVDVTRADGGRTAQDLPLRQFPLVADVSQTLCSVRPDLRDYELSGPVVRPGAVEGG